MRIIFIFYISILLFACESEDRKAIQDLNEELSSVVENATDLDKPYASEKNISSQPKASGLAGKLEKAMRDAINIGIDFRNEYQGELVKVGWEELLLPGRIYHDDELTESKIILEKAHDVIELYSERNMDVLLSVREVFSNSDLSDKHKEEALRGFDSKLELQKLQNKKIWDLEFSAYKEIESLIYWLAENINDWAPQDGQFIFYDDAKLEVFNQYLVNIQKITDEQIEITNQGASRASEALSKLESEF